MVAMVLLVGCYGVVGWFLGVAVVLLGGCYVLLWCCHMFSVVVLGVYRCCYGVARWLLGGAMVFCLVVAIVLLGVSNVLLGGC